MSQKTKALVRMICSLVLSIMLFVVAVLFIVSCVGIYKSGASPFTRASVAEAVGKISVPVLITVLIAICSAVFEFLDSSVQKIKAEKDDFRTLRLVSKRFSINKAPAASVRAIMAERVNRFSLIAANMFLYVVGAVISLFYVLNVDNYSTTDPNSSIMNAFIVIVLCLLPAFVVNVVLLYVIRKSVRREVEEIKAVLKAPVTDLSSEDVMDTKKLPAFLSSSNLFFKKKERLIKGVITSVCIILGVTFVILGALNGGFSDVIQKAVKICTECIGMG